MMADPPWRCPPITAARGSTLALGLPPLLGGLLHPGLVTAVEGRSAIGLLVAHVLDHRHQVVDIHGGGVVDEAAGQLALRMQLARLIERPDLLAVVGGQQLRGEAVEVAAHVVTARLNNHWALVLPAAATGWGRSVVTGPAAAIS